METFTIEGGAIFDIASFYAELNRVFMAGESWTLGQSLDALDDMLYGGYGALKDKERVRIVWRDIDKSRQALGLATTRAYYQAKLAQPERYDTEIARKALAALEAGEGPTYFEIVLQIIAEHDTVELIRA
ncbi:barstar family protein [Pelagibacterium mangrovi]|uniref:barstar family protein n=1 Tax=Pelagibacterium mangrovi TaxID=3119828 RepID=UPI002FCA2C89